MSHHFKSRYDEMKASSNAVSHEKDTQAEDTSYYNIGHSRNVCFVLLDCDEVFLNYAYLVSGKYFIEDGRIVLLFTSDTVTLKGINLKKLYEDFHLHIPLKVVSCPTRYNDAEEPDTPIVNEITVTANS